MPHVKTWKTYLYGGVIGVGVLAASLGFAHIKDTPSSALTIDKPSVFQQAISTISNLLRAEKHAIDISDVAGVYRTENGLTSNDFTVENPTDLYAVQRIFDNLVENTARTTPAGQKIVFVIGESHVRPAEEMGQIFLNSAVTRIYGPSSHVFCYERPYNTLEDIVQTNLELTVPSNLTGRLHEHDPNGFLLLLGHIGFANEESNVSASEKSVLLHALRSDVPVMFTDATLLGFDPVARDVAMNMHGVDLSVEYLSDVAFKGMDTRGVDVRNGVMVKRAIDFSETHNADVIVQHCGSNHIFGTKREGISFKNSLTSLFYLENFKVVPIFFSRERDEYTAENIIPDTALVTFSDAVIIRGISEDEKGETNMSFLVRKYVEVAKNPISLDNKPEKFNQEAYKNTIDSIFRSTELTPK